MLPVVCSPLIGWYPRLQLVLIYAPPDFLLGWWIRGVAQTAAYGLGECECVDYAATLCVVVVFGHSSSVVFGIPTARW